MPRQLTITRKTAMDITLFIAVFSHALYYFMYWREYGADWWYKNDAAHVVALLILIRLYSKLWLWEIAIIYATFNLYDELRGKNLQPGGEEFALHALTIIWIISLIIRLIACVCNLCTNITCKQKNA